MVAGHNTHIAHGYLTSIEFVSAVCVCVSAVGSYRRGGGAHCSLDRGEVHHASDDLHHASGRCAATVWVRVRCMSRCGALEQSTQVWVHMHELMQKQIKGVT